MRRRSIVLLLALMTALALLPATASAAAQEKPNSNACDNRTNNTFKKLLECVTLDGVREHQGALQAAADVNDGTRAAGTPGYDASVAYVVDTLEAAGYDVELWHRCRAGHSC